jgi:hypothetical protein
MKQLIGTIKVEEVENEGFATFFDKPILLFCANYFYAGTLVGINDDFVKLENATIVYETGAFNTDSYKDAQFVPGKTVYVMKRLVEAFCAGK